MSNLSLEQQATLLLWQRVNTSLSAFYKLVKTYGRASAALDKSVDDWASLGIHAKHLERFKAANQTQDEAFLAAIARQLQAGTYQLLFSDSPIYPTQLHELYDPPPVLFCRGNLTCLNDAQIAIVGSRKPTSKAQKLTFDMAQYLVQAGFVITSGLAQGVDAQAHLGALAQTEPSLQGRTVGVMGTGIDVCYPKQHAPLFERIINEGGCIITELLPGTPANKHTFPRRNRLVAGLSLGTIVTEAALKSGSLITARLTSEQGKQVFALPSSIDNANAEGCHHLIREGATLIYHPDHVISDLSSQLTSSHSNAQSNQVPSDHVPLNQEPLNQRSQNNLAQAASMSNESNQFPQNALIDSKNSPSSTQLPKPNPNSKLKTSAQPPVNADNKTGISVSSATAQTAPTANIPKHLQALWVHIDWEGQDLDALVHKTKLDTPSLLSQLMELELLGAVEQVGGRYLRKSSS